MIRLFLQKSICISCFYSDKLYKLTVFPSPERTLQSNTYSNPPHISLTGSSGCNPSSMPNFLHLSGEDIHLRRQDVYLGGEDTHLGCKDEV